MKNILFKSLFVLTLAGLISACSDVIEAPTKSSLDENVIFSTPVLAEGAVMGIHQSFSESVDCALMAMLKTTRNWLSCLAKRSPCVLLFILIL